MCMIFIFFYININVIFGFFLCFYRDKIVSRSCFFTTFEQKIIISAIFKYNMVPTMSYIASSEPAFSPIDSLMS